MQQAHNTFANTALPSAGAWVRLRGCMLVGIGLSRPHSSVGISA